MELFLFKYAFSERHLVCYYHEPGYWGSLRRPLLARVSKAITSYFALPNRRKQEWRWPAIVLLITAMAAGLRFYGLGDQSLWLDEAISVVVAKQSLSFAAHHAAADVHPPLYYILLHGWVSLGDQEFLIRFPSLFFDVMSVPLIYILGSLLFDRKTGTLASSLLAVSPLHVRYSQEGRMYTLLGLCALISILSTLRFLGTRHGKWLIANLVFSTLAIYTHYQAAFIILFNNLIVIPTALRDRRFMVKWLLSQASVVVAFSPWLSTLWNQISRGGRVWIPFQPRGDVLLSTWAAQFVGEWLLPHQMGMWNAVMLAALSILALLLLSSTARGRQSSAILSAWILTGVLMPFVVSVRLNVFGPKYLMGVSFAGYLLLAGGLWALGKRWPAWALLLIIGCGLPSLVALANYYWTPFYQRENWRDAITYIEQQTTPDDVVAFEFYGPMDPWIHYSRGHVPAVGLVHIEATSGEIERSVTNLVSQYGRIWLFEYLAGLYDPQGLVVSSLESHKWAKIQWINFNGVPLSLWVPLTQLKTVVLNDFESMANVRSAWDHNLSESSINLNHNPRFISEGGTSLEKRMVTNSSSEVHYGGIEFPIQSTRFMVDIWLPTPGEVRAIYVYAYNREGKLSARWGRNFLQEPLRSVASPLRVYFVDGFWFVRDSERLPSKANILIEVDKPNQAVSFFVDNLLSW